MDAGTAEDPGRLDGGSAVVDAGTQGDGGPGDGGLRDAGLADAGLADSGCTGLYDRWADFVQGPGVQSCSADVHCALIGEYSQTCNCNQNPIMGVVNVAFEAEADALHAAADACGLGGICDYGGMHSPRCVEGRCTASSICCNCPVDAGFVDAGVADAGGDGGTSDAGMCTTNNDWSAFGNAPETKACIAHEDCVLVGDYRGTPNCGCAALGLSGVVNSESVERANELIANACGDAGGGVVCDVGASYDPYCSDAGTCVAKQHCCGCPPDAGG